MVKINEDGTPAHEGAESTTVENNEQTTGTEEGGAPASAVVAIGFRDKMKPILSERFPDRNLDDDADYESAMDEYHTSMTEELGKHKESARMMAEKFSENPVVASFLHDVFGGEDVVASLVRHFGEDVAEASNNPEKLALITEAASTRSAKMKQDAEIAAEQETNWANSLKEIEAYQTESGKSPEEMNALFDQIMTLHTNGIMGIITKEDLVKYDKMLNYDADVAEAEQIGAAQGRNENIDLKKGATATAPLPDLNGAAAQTETEPENGAAKVLGRMGQRQSLRERGQAAAAPRRRF